ncbi:MAG: hypothetical protein IPP73_12580 [Chitinophagaceae bacterium]|nr:hypothetical protein [Chitinophagaceae bacterium]
MISSTGTKTLVDDLDIAGDFTNNGNLDAGTGTVAFGGTSAQTIGGSSSNIVQNLTINNTAGVSADADITVNGILNLQSGNPSLSSGTLAMGSGKILSMGDIATTTGAGDVTGIIRRTPSGGFALNTEYSFVNANTIILFTSVPAQTLPSSASVKVTLGTAPSWGVGTPANAISRVLDISQSGGTGTKALLRSHYRDEEIPSGVNESLLSMWIYKSSIPLIYEKGKSAINIIDNNITVQDVDYGTGSK